MVEVMLMDGDGTELCTHTDGMITLTVDGIEYELEFHKAGEGAVLIYLGNGGFFELKAMNSVVLSKGLQLPNGWGGMTGERK